MNKQFRGSLIDINTVKKKTGFRSTQTIYNKMANEGFPRAIAVGTRSKRWIEEEINAWIEARISESRQEGKRYD